MTLHLAPSLQPQQEFSGPHTLDNLLQALLQRGCITQAAADAATAAAAAAHTPAAVAATAAAAAAAACRGPLRPPFRSAAVGLEQDSDGQQHLDETAAAAVDGARQGLLPESQRQQQQQRQFKLVKRGAADLKQLLQQVAPSQLLLLAWSPAQSSSAAAAAAGDQPDAGSDSPAAGVIDSTDAVESLAAALAAAAAAANSANLVVVAVADADASTANQALAAALSVQQPVVQLYHNRQVVKAVRVGGLGVAAAVGKVQKAVLQVLQQAREQAQQQKGVGSGPATAAAAGAGAAKATTAPSQDSSSSTAASTGTAAAVAAGGSSSGGATQSSSDTTTTTATTSSSSSMWDPPAPKAGKPVKAGAKLSFPASAVFGASSSSSTASSTVGSTAGKKAGSTVKVVYWPRMPCLSCGCPYWLGEDWDASCARCGWSCEEGGYDDDSNPLPQHAQRYKDIVTELKAGRTPSGLQPLQE